MVIPYMGSYSGLKRDDILTRAAVWMVLGDSTWSEISQLYKDESG